MNKMKDFRGIADEIMKDVSVSNTLKEETLAKCRNKRRFPDVRILVPAVCFILILGIAGVFSILSVNMRAGNDQNPENRLMTGTGEGIGTLPEKTGNNSGNESGATKNRLLKTPDEAKKGFGDAFLTPSYVPEGFKLEKIHASGPDENNVTKIVLSCFKGEQSFIIIEEKTEMQFGFVGFKKIDINGTTGYLKPDSPDSGENAGSEDNEVHWLKDGVHYSVMGQITKDEAVNTAISMK